MSIRQDSVQIRIDFLTDESKAFAGTIKETERFRNELQKAQKDVASLAKEQERLAAQGKDTTNVSLKLAAAEQKVAENLKSIADSGKGIAAIDLSKLLPSQLTQRATQLKQALNFIHDGHPDRVQMEQELKAINTQLSDMNARTRGASSAMDDMNKRSTNSFSSMVSWVSKLTVAWYGLQQFLSALWKPSQLASEMQNAQIAFETMLGSAIQARALVNQVIKTAANTPFEQAELIDYTKRLLAMGIESTKVVGTLENLGNISAAVGKEKLPQLVLAYGQVAAKTKLAGGELKQFTEAGVPLVGVLADQLKTTEANIFKLVEAGKIGFKDVEKAIASLTTEGGKFAGLMGKQAQTTEGLLSTLKDNTNLALAAFGEGFNRVFSQMLRDANSMASGLDRESLKKFGETVGQVVKFVVDFTPALVKLFAVYGTFKVINAASLALQSWYTIIRTNETLQLLFNNGLARTILLKTALNRLFSLSALPIWGAALVAATFAAQSLIEKLTELSAHQKEVNESTKEATTSVIEQRTQSDALFAILRDGNTTYDQKQKALKRILELYPDYLGNIKTQSQLLGHLDEAQRRVNQAIFEEAIARVKAAKMQEKSAELIEIRLQKAEAERKRLEALTTGHGNYDFTDDTGTRQTGNTIAEGYDRDISALETRISGLSAGMIQFSKDFDKAGLDIAKSLSSEITPGFKLLDVEIQQVRDQLARTTDAASKKALELRLKQLENQRRLEVDHELGTVKKRQEIADEGNAKAAAKAEKDRLKRLKDQHAVNIGEAEVYWEMELLLQQVALSKKEITKAEFSEQELLIENLKYENLLAIQTAYLAKLEKGTKEYVHTQKEMLKLGENITENNGILNRPKVDVVEQLGKRENTEGVKSQTGEALSKIQANADIEKSLVRRKFGDLLTMEQQFEIKKLEIQSEAFQQQLEVLKANGASETEEYKRIAKAKETIDKAVVDEKKRLADIEQGIEKAKQEIYQNAFTVAADLFTSSLEQEKQKNKEKSDGIQKRMDELEKAGKKESAEYKQLQKDKEAVDKEDLAMRKKRGETIKAFQIAQIVTNGILEVQKIWATVAEYGPAGPIIGAILTGLTVARTAVSVNRVKAQQFASGGIAALKSGIFGGRPHSAGGTQGYFSDGTQIEVEKGEAFAVVNKRNTPLLRALSVVNAANGNGKPYFADGGVMNLNTTPTGFNQISTPSVQINFDTKILGDKLDKLTNIVASQQTQLKAFITIDDLEAKQKSVAQDRADAAY